MQNVLGDIKWKWVKSKSKNIFNFTSVEIYLKSNPGVGVKQKTFKMYSYIVIVNF